MKREGNCGHFEVLLPTVLLHHGYSVQDIGGTGKFTPPKCHNRFYIQSVGINNGTIRWRPVFSKEEIEQIKRDNILVHPCKELEKNNKMKHAILIMAHGHISNLHKIIGYFSNDCDCFIHIDKKTILKEEETLLIKKHEQVKLLSQELNVNWGGTSELDCVLFLLEKAYNFSNYDYFHLISGQDYPTRPLSQFLDFFVQNEGKSFIQYIKLPHPRWEHGTFRRLQYYYPYDYASDKENPRHWVHEQVKMQIEKGVKRPVPNAFDCLYGSSQWFSITNEAVNILLDYTRKEPALYRSMWMTFAPEECYVATVLCNLLEKDKIVGFNHRFIRWKFENGNRPANLSKEHFFYLLKDKYFFARKMTPPYSTELLPLIDKYLLKDGVVQLSKTGAWLYDGFLKYEYDSKFAEYVHKLCLDISAKSAIDFGCGPGYYVAKWKEMGLPFVGYDANPYTKSLSSLLCQNEDDFCEIADLTAKLDIEEPFELVVCKDVLPYIPKHLIANVINNLIKLSSHIILLSWHISDIQSYIPHHAVSKERLIDSFAKRNFIVEKFLTSQIQIIMNSEDYLIFIKKGHQIIN